MISPTDPSELSNSFQSSTLTIPAVLGSFAIAFACDHYIGDRKIFGGTTPKTVAIKEWWEETDRKFQAWPRAAGPPVVMNPISRQNFIVKSRTESRRSHLTLN